MRQKVGKCVLQFSVGGSPGGQGNLFFTPATSELARSIGSGYFFCRSTEESMEKCTYRILNPQDAQSYEHMTSPIYRSRLRNRTFEEKSILAIGAIIEKKPVGLVLTQIGSDDNAEIISIFTQKDFRQQGIATDLIAYCLKALSEYKCQEVKTFYENNRTYSPWIESILKKLSFLPPKPYSLVCRCHGSKLRKAPWLQKSLLPAAFEIFPWSELAEAEKEKLRSCNAKSLCYPDLLTPFRETSIIEPLNSLGLRYKNEVVGWQINHRVSVDTIRYTAMFVREDLQNFGLAIPLMSEAIRRQLYSGQFWLDRATFVVPFEMAAMIRFVHKHMMPYVDHVNECLEARKELPGVEK